MITLLFQLLWSLTMSILVPYRISFVTSRTCYSNRIKRVIIVKWFLNAKLNITMYMCDLIYDSNYVELFNTDRFWKWQCWGRYSPVERWAIRQEQERGVSSHVVSTEGTMKQGDSKTADRQSEPSRAPCVRSVRAPLLGGGSARVAASLRLILACHGEPTSPLSLDRELWLWALAPAGTRTTIATTEAFSGFYCR